MLRLQRAAAVLRRQLHAPCRQAHNGRKEVAPGSGRQADLSGLGPKRFYEHVDVAAQADGTFAVTVDGKVVKTPRRGSLAAPTRALATAVAAEWDAQEGRIRPSSMPLTTLVSTARDIVPSSRDTFVAQTLRFLDTDTVCIRPAYPSELVEAQDQAFAPVVAHLASRGVDLNVVRGGLSAPQGDDAREVLQGALAALDDYSLAAVDSAAGSAKSVAIAIALADGAVSPAQAVTAARSEEQWQMRVWGCVEGGHDLDDADILVRLAAADAIFKFVALDPEAFPGRLSHAQDWRG